VAEPPAGERTLEQFDALCLFRKMFEGHARLNGIVRAPGRWANKILLGVEFFPIGIVL
jgi:hypothetical protein